MTCGDAGWHDHAGGGSDGGDPGPAAAGPGCSGWSRYRTSARWSWRSCIAAPSARGRVGPAARDQFPSASAAGSPGGPGTPTTAPAATSGTATPGPADPRACTSAARPDTATPPTAASTRRSSTFAANSREHWLAIPQAGESLYRFLNPETRQQLFPRIASKPPADHPRHSPR